VGDDGHVTKDSLPLLVLPGGLAVVRLGDRARSMLPTLAPGDRLLVRAGRRAVGRARDGRLVVVRLPGGRPVSVKRLAHTDTDGWWVERDNPREGVDSWHVGAIGGDDRVAVVVARIWPRPGLLRGAAHAQGRGRG
jgi:hypothetical protein